jgi:hypothetical protein
MLSKKSKKRIIAGVVGLSLVGGTVTAFASVDVANELGSWYSSKIGPILVNIGATVGAYTEGKINNDLTPYANEQKSAAVTAVTNEGTTEEGRATGEVNTYYKAYSDALDAKSNSIQNTDIPWQFRDEYLTMLNGLQLNGSIYTQGITPAKNALKSSISTEVPAAGVTAKAGVTTNVGATKNQVITDLQNKIAAVKAEIQVLLDKKATETTAAAKAYVDQQILAAKTEINTLTTQLRDAQIALIQAEGQTIETSAKSELDKLVEGIY